MQELTDRIQALVRIGPLEVFDQASRHDLWKMVPDTFIFLSKPVAARLGGRLCAPLAVRRSWRGFIDLSR
jgi:hypothetical protein